MMQMREEIYKILDINRHLHTLRYDSKLSTFGIFIILILGGRRPLIG